MLQSGIVSFLANDNTKVFTLRFFGLRALQYIWLKHYLPLCRVRQKHWHHLHRVATLSYAETVLESGFCHVVRKLLRSPYPLRSEVACL